MGPISLCLKVTDADKKPIIYRDEVRELVVRHIAAKVNRHLRDLRAIHPHAFVWVDEPGLEILFTGIAGYSAERARADLDLFTSLLEGPRGSISAATPTGISSCTPTSTCSPSTPTGWPTSWRATRTASGPCWSGAG